MILSRSFAGVAALIVLLFGPHLGSSGSGTIGGTALGDGGSASGQPRPRLVESRTRQAIRDIIKCSVRIETEDGLGSGTIVDASGWILTSAHVIEGCREVVVTLTDGRRFEADVRGVNGGGDLALIRIPAKDLPVAKVGEPDALARGDWVIAAGHPSSAFDDFQPTISLGRLRVLEGRIRASDTKLFERALVSDVPLSAGSSGGGLWNLDGRLVGVNAAVTRNERSSFSVRITEFLRDADRLRRGERFDRVPEARTAVRDWREGRGDFSRGQWFTRTFPEVRGAALQRSVTIETPQGSIRGVIVSARGEVLTVSRALSHVSVGEECRLRRGDAKAMNARLVGRDLAHDVAMLQLPLRAKPYPCFDLSRFAPSVAGTLVMTPNQRGLDGGILSSSGPRRPPNELKGLGYLPGVLQCDLRLWRDQVGAPLVDARGSLLGLVLQHRLKRTEDRWERAPFGAFALPVDRLRESRDVILKKGSRAAPEEGFFGVVLRDLSESEKRARGVIRGVLAERVERGMAASRGGLRGGDVILGLSGQALSSRGETIHAIASRAPGSRVTVEIDRQGRRMILDVRVGRRNDRPVIARPG